MPRHASETMRSELPRKRALHTFVLAAAVVDRGEERADVLRVDAAARMLRPRRRRDSMVLFPIF